MSDTAWFVEKITDLVVSVGGVNYGLAANAMSSPFFTEADPNGIVDLCKTGSSTDIAIMQRSDTTQYSLNAQMFVRGRPPHR